MTQPTDRSVLVFAVLACLWPLALGAHAGGCGGRAAQQASSGAHGGGGAAPADSGPAPEAGGPCGARVAVRCSPGYAPGPSQGGPPLDCAHPDAGLWCCADAAPCDPCAANGCQ